jgi:hypothetical protein
MPRPFNERYNASIVKLKPPTPSYGIEYTRSFIIVTLLVLIYCNVVTITKTYTQQHTNNNIPGRSGTFRIIVWQCVTKTNKNGGNTACSYR